MIENILKGREKNKNKKLIEIIFSKSKYFFNALINSIENTKNKIYLLEILKLFPKESHTKLIRIKNKLIKSKNSQKKIRILKYLIKNLIIN